MPIDSPRALYLLSRRRLALGLVAALGCSLSSARAATEMPTDMSVMMERLPYVHERARFESAASKRTPTHPAATTHFVDTCADDGSPNSLRSLIELSPNVHSGDAIDLTQLPMMCSKITLSSAFADGAITVTQDTLYLQGPGADQLTIDANGYSSVLRHYGYGTLQIEGMTITNGYHKTAGPPQPLPRGGCIFSTGSVVLTSSVVSHCEAVSSSDNLGARGGAIDAEGDVRLYFSSILDSGATAPSFSAIGGAVMAKNFAASYSTVRDNSAIAVFMNSDAGGVFAYDSIALVGSTISGNRADWGGGMQVGGGTIANSSITDNVALYAFGGFTAGQPIKVVNSTIAFNKAIGGVKGGAGIGLFSMLNIQSSIVAANLNQDGAADIGAEGLPGFDAASKDNLIIASELPLPPGTISNCPKLGPLVDNGGPTLTHALNQASPAIDHGDNAAFLDSDQRQLARVIGARADIGAVEWSPTDHDERIFLGGFDAKCEW